MSFALDPSETALLLIDVQNFVLDPAEHPPRPEFYARTTQTVMPTLEALLGTARSSDVEVMYTVMENLTRDGRDRSLDYKLSGFNIPKGSPGGRVAARCAPQGDEIVLRKSSACLFHSTNFDFVARNLGISTILCTGFLTDQCVEQTMKAGASLGYRMVCVEDACATNTDARHQAAVERIGVSGEIVASGDIRTALAQ
ncbi:isochorismatase family cysteine hydrolase [uncultured Jannaschia sp.]|uniref:cysteine hydrolase family protein n=1 Tax=uncultured Jannaschia sp. TaxID=293347 RepID=UPI0026101A64|nr:isochorismatase family cysteine hydrolase [uncultured Jannaschia sp.]